jgi:hypothetical protein
MAASYALGSVYTWEAERTPEMALSMGVIATVLFVGIRAFNLYGESESVE